MKVGIPHEVGVSCRVAFLDDSRNGRSPSMVAPRIEEALINCSANKAVLEILLFLFGTFVNVEHLRKRVSMVLEPKFILPLYVFVRSVEVRIRF